MRLRERVRSTEQIAGPGLIPGVRAWLIPAASETACCDREEFYLGCTSSDPPMPSQRAQPPATY